MLAVIDCQFKKNNCNPYLIVIMIIVLIMNVIFWVVNFKIQNYFAIYTTQNVYLRLSMYDCSNFVH
jgi:dipeptide/tripeptide permease